MINEKEENSIGTLNEAVESGIAEGNVADRDDSYYDSLMEKAIEEKIIEIKGRPNSAIKYAAPDFSAEGFDSKDLTRSEALNEKIAAEREFNKSLSEALKDKENADNERAAGSGSGMGIPQIFKKILKGNQFKNQAKTQYLDLAAENSQALIDQRIRSDAAQEVLKEQSDKLNIMMEESGGDNSPESIGEEMASNDAVLEQVMMLNAANNYTSNEMDSLGEIVSDDVGVGSDLASNEGSTESIEESNELLSKITELLSKAFKFELPSFSPK